MSPAIRALNKEALKLTDEMYRLEGNGSDPVRLSVIYARLVEIETTLWS